MSTLASISFVDHGIFFALGVLASLVSVALLSWKSWTPRVRDSWRKAFSRTPNVTALETLVAESYQPYTIGKGRPYYWIRTKRPQEKKPIYHFFIGGSIRLERFLGFLIPPLDSGHGRNHEGVSLSDEWDKYLRHVTDAASHSTDKRRIVFFDKTLLLLFLSDTKRIFGDAKMVGASFMPLDPVPPATSSARRVVKYAYDIAKIHSLIKGIDCRYIAKDKVAANEYYDFGLYQIEGTPIVYTPIHYKDDIKSIACEKIYIGTTARQRRGIEPFVNDFERLWNMATNACDRQAGQEAQITDQRLSNLSDQYYELDYLLPALFEAGYVRQIRAIIAEFMNRNIDAEDLHQKSLSAAESARPTPH